MTTAVKCRSKEYWSTSTSELYLSKLTFQYWLELRGNHSNQSSSIWLSDFFSSRSCNWGTCTLVLFYSITFIRLREPKKWIYKNCADYKQMFIIQIFPMITEPINTNKMSSTLKSIKPLILYMYPVTKTFLGPFYRIFSLGTRFCTIDDKNWLQSRSAAEK